MISAIPPIRIPAAIIIPPASVNNKLLCISINSCTTECSQRSVEVPRIPKIRSCEFDDRSTDDVAGDCRHLLGT